MREGKNQVIWKIIQPTHIFPHFTSYIFGKCVNVYVLEGKVNDNFLFDLIYTRK